MMGGGEGEDSGFGDEGGGVEFDFVTGEREGFHFGFRINPILLSSMTRATISAFSSTLSRNFSIPKQRYQVVVSYPFFFSEFANQNTFLAIGPVSIQKLL